MQTTIKKFAPQGIVLAVMLYWSWPALAAFLPQSGVGGDKTESKKAAGPKDFAVMLSPKFLPVATRNPFQVCDAKNATAAKSVRGKVNGKDGKAAADIRGTDLVLNATLIAGRQRMAIINGHVYREKEAVPRPGDAAASCILTEILPHKVLLSYEGTTLQLTYLNAAVKPAATPAAGSDPRKPPK